MRRGKNTHTKHKESNTKDARYLLEAPRNKKNMT